MLTTCWTDPCVLGTRRDDVVVKRVPLDIGERSSVTTDSPTTAAVHASRLPTTRPSSALLSNYLTSLVLMLIRNQVVKQAPRVVWQPHAHSTVKWQRVNTQCIGYRRLSAYRPRQIVETVYGQVESRSTPVQVKSYLKSYLT